jgi:hypothetical protein
MIVQDGPWAKYRAQTAPQAPQQPLQAPAGGLQVKPAKQPDPIELERLAMARNAEARAAADQARQEALAPIQREAALADLQNKGRLQESERTATFLTTRVAGGIKKLAEIGPEGGPTVGSEVAGMFGKWGNYATPELRQRTAAAQLDILDAALTLGTGAAYNKEQLEAYRQSYFPQIGDGPGTVADKQERLRVLLEAAKAKAGSGAGMIDQALAVMGANAPPAKEGGAPEIATGKERRYSTDADKAFAAAAQTLFDNGGGRKDLDALAAKYGAPPFGPDLDRAIESRRKGGGGVKFATNQSGIENLSVAQQAAGALAQSGAGGALMGAAPGLTLGGADELIGGLDALANGRPMDEAVAEANLKKSLIADANPTAYLVGNVAGGAAGLVGVQGVLARGGTAAARTFSAPALAADAGYGAVSGALESNENRTTGALTGAALGAGGGAVGRGLARGSGRAVAPTGGDLKPLYDAGVRPTPGQRFGGVVGLTEEALGSVPLVGSAVRGSRQAARDQFERGAFDQALSEIGEKLPAKIKLGTEPHKFAQDAFNRAYAAARSKMRFARDQQFDTEFRQLVQDIANGGLEDASAKRFQAIIKSQVDRKMAGGRMTGTAYKEAQSALGKRIRALRNSPAADQELAGALEDFSTLLDAAARRASPKEAVDALDAADAGYAKLVRIEEAAKGAGEAGRFTPNQFDRAVKNAAGGRAARSKAYQRGDALMQDYATAGRSLIDTLPNSGTADRQMLTGGLMGTAGSLISPAAALAPALATLPYVPGVRTVTNALLAPRASARANSVGNALLEGGRLTGPIGTVAALQYQR